MNVNNYFHVNNKFTMKLTSIFIIIAFVSMLLPSRVIADDVNSLFTISRTVDTTDIKVGDSFNVKYNITPTNIPIVDDSTVKDIVLVLDTSGSMGDDPEGDSKYIGSRHNKELNPNYKTKIDIIKDVANNFINDFKNDENTNIGLIDFNNKANIRTPELLSASEENLQTLTTIIYGNPNGNGNNDSVNGNSNDNGNSNNDNTNNNNKKGLIAQGATNIGDGLRNAYYLLNKDDGHNKYIVFMSDGAATMYSVKTPNSDNYYLDAGEAPHTAGNGYSDKDHKSFNYAKEIATDYLSKSSIKTSIIGFGAEADPNNNEIARIANNIKSGDNDPYYHDAADENAITTLYNSIQHEIATTIYGRATFTETFDSSKLDVDLSSLPAGLTVSGNTIAGKIDIEYKLSTDGKYTASPVSLPITFKAKAYGNSVLGQNGNSSSVTLSVSNKTETKYFDQYTVSIGQANGAKPPTIDANTAWTKNSVPVTITPGAKGDSNVVGIKYKLTDLNDKVITDWTTNNSPNAFSFNVDKEGQTKIIARTIDQVGDSSDSEPVVVKIDRTAPTTPIISLDTTDWSNKDVNFTIYGSTDTDGSGVNKYQYKIGDNGTWQDYNDQVTISTEGQHTIYAQAIDNVGNVSPISSKIVKIDKTKPSTPVIHPDTTDWTNKDVNFTIDSSIDKDGSGVNEYQYKIDDNGAWQDYNGSGTVSAEGQHTIYAQAIDNAGNISDSSNVSVKIDKTKPTLSYTLDHTNLDNNPVKITVSVGDALSGIDHVINPDGSDAILDTGNNETFTVSDNGNYIFKVYDKAGNEYDETVPVTNIVSLKLNGTVDNVNNWINLNWNKPGPSQEYSYKVFRNQPMNSNLNTGSSGLNQISQISTGNSSVEQKTIEGTLFSLIQTTTDTSLQDKDGKDVNAPNAPSLNSDSVTSDGTTVNINFNGVEDIGTDYKYFVEAIGQSDGYIIDSNVVSLENKSGIKGYYVSIDNDANGVPTKTVLSSPADIGNIMRNYSGKDFYVHVAAVDNGGNISPVATYHYDKEAPVSPVITVIPDDNVRVYNVDGSHKNASGNVTFTIEGSTDTSTPLKYEYNLDNGGWTAVAEGTPVHVMGEGNHTIIARVTDATGNVSSTTTQNVLIDMTPPAKPTITLNPNVTEWTNQDVSFTIDGSTDSGSGLKKYQYKIDDGLWTDYTGAVAVITEGQHTISARAVDNVDNISVESNTGVDIDKTGPSAPTIGVSPDSAKTIYTNEDVTFTLQSIDLFSGVQKYQYQIDNTSEGGWIDYSEVNAKITTSGEHTIYARAIDNAGNISEVSSQIVYVDKGPSVPTITGNTDWTNNNVIFTIGGSVDVKGNPVDYQYKIDNGDWIDYNSENKVTVSVKKDDGSSNEGIHTIVARAKDNLIADFYSDETPQVQAKIDTTPPPTPNITSHLSTDGNKAEVTIDYLEDISGVSGQQASGLKDKKYTVNGQEYYYTGPFKVSQGSVIYAKSVDFAGNSNENYATAVTANFIADDSLIVPRSDDVKNYAANFTFNINVGQDQLEGAKGSITVTDENGNYVPNSLIQLRIGSIDTNPSQALSGIENGTKIFVSALAATPEGTYYIKLTSPSVTEVNSKIIKLYVKNLILH